MFDLYNNKYNRQTIKDNIFNVSLVDILKTQTIDVTFVVRYILNNKYQLLEEEKCITLQIVVKYQPHITYKELQRALLEYECDNDSIDDFETVANRV